MIAWNNRDFGTIKVMLNIWARHWSDELDEKQPQRAKDLVLMEDQNTVALKKIYNDF